jgi:hypothetical protein
MDVGWEFEPLEWSRISTPESTIFIDKYKSYEHCLKGKFVSWPRSEYMPIIADDLQSSLTTDN